MMRKKRLVLPRLLWYRNPVTRIKESNKIYNRKRKKAKESVEEGN
jgi:hypothetical protein